MFVPIVIGIAVLTVLGWGLLAGNWQAAMLNRRRAGDRLPLCAQSCHTDSHMAGTGGAARHGILIKDAEALEVAHRVQVVAFDKMGIFTEGKPQVVAAQAVDGARLAVLSLAGSLQAGSEHPLAKAVLEAASKNGLQLQPASQRPSAA